MKIKVTKFIVAPIYIVIDDEGLVVNEGEGPQFNFYPGAPFDIQQTISDAERLIGKKLGYAEQLSLLDAIKDTELTTQ